MIINTGNLRTLGVGYKAHFQQALGQAEAQYAQISMMVPSSTAKEEYGWLGKVPSFREWIGPRVVQNLKTHDWTIKNRPFENTIGVDRDDIEDDNIGIYSPLFAEMGLATAAHPDELVWPLLASGFSTACYDGQYFFDTDHPVLDADGSETSVSNFGGGAGTAWYLMDLSRMMKPVIFQTRRPYDFQSFDNANDVNVFNNKEFIYGVDARVAAGFGLWQLGYGSKDVLNEANYAAARVAMFEMKGDYRRPLNLRPTHLVVPPALEDAALTIVKKILTGGGDTNIYLDTAKVIVVPWLS